MPRVDLYGIIHKTLRELLFDTSTQISRTNFADPGERSRLLAQFTRAMGFVEEHGHHEDTFVDPPLKAASAELAEEVQTKHKRLVKEAEALAGLVAQLRSAEGGDAVGLGARLHRDFSDYLSGYLGHMASEEGPCNAALWAKYTDDELAQIRTELQGSIPPPRFAEWFALMVSAMNFQERVGVLTGMKQGAPAPVFEAMSGVAKEAIGDQAWSQVEAALPPG